jgi:hypothetical protein
MPLIADGPGAAQTMDDLDVTLCGYESRLLEMNAGYQLLSGRLAELIEARHVLRETAVFFQQVRGLYLPRPRPNQIRARSAHHLMIVPRQFSNITIMITSTLRYLTSSSTPSKPPLLGSTGCLKEGRILPDINLKGIGTPVTKRLDAIISPTQ